MTILPFLHDATIAAFLGLTAVAALSDVRRLSIPNWLCLAVLAVYPFFVLTAPEPVAWTWALGLAGLVLVAGFVLFAFGLFGGGDAKLLAAAAVWAGPGQLIDFILATALAGGLVGLLMLSPARMALAIALPDGEFKNKLLSDTLPYGLPIAVGAWVVGIRLLIGGPS